MSYMRGLFEGLNERRQEESARSLAEQQKLGDMEMSVLMQLAQGPDDELAALAGAGILETISGKGKIGKAKGLQGVLGTAQRSSYLPAIQAALQARKSGLGQGMPPAPASAGGAALPNASPIEPKAQTGATPMGGGLPPVPAPPAAQMGPIQQAALGLVGEPPAGPAGLDGVGAEEPGSGGVGLPPLPPRPELPQEARMRLFPNAAEVAQQAERAKLEARYRAIIAALADPNLNALQRNAVLGVAGAPQAQATPQQAMITYVGPDGQPRTELGLAKDGQAIVGGRVVRATAVELLNLRTPRPVVEKYQLPDGTEGVRYRDPDNPGVVLFDSGSTGRPGQLPPNPFGPPVDQGDGRLNAYNRGAGRWETIGRENPSANPPSGKGQGQKDAEGIVAAVQARMKSELAKRVESGKYVMGKPESLTDSEMDALTTLESGGRYRRYADLLRASKGGSLPDVPAGPGQGAAAGAPPAGPPAFGSPDAAAAIAAQLAKRTQRR